jgi:hypothetical protein
MAEDKPSPLAHADTFETSAEREAARRAQLYDTHKKRGTLGLYFYMFPDECPPGYFDRQKSAENERER